MGNYKKKKATSHSNSSRNCRLCLEEKLAIITLKSQNKLLNKMNKIMGKCKNLNKDLPCYLNTNIKRNERNTTQNAIPSQTAIPSI